MVVASVFKAGLVLQTIMPWQEPQGKRRLLKLPYRAYPPEVLGSIWDQISLWWLIPLFFEGFRSLLTTDVLYHVDADLTARYLEAKFTHNWKSSVSPSRQ